MRVWIPSPPQRVIGPAAYYPLEGGGVMKEPPPSLVVAGLTNFILPLNCWPTVKVMNQIRSVVGPAAGRI